MAVFGVRLPSCWLPLKPFCRVSVSGVATNLLPGATFSGCQPSRSTERAANFFQALLIAPVRDDNGSRECAGVAKVGQAWVCPGSGPSVKEQRS